MNKNMLDLLVSVLLAVGLLFTGILIMIAHNFTELFMYGILFMGFLWSIVLVTQDE